MSDYNAPNFNASTGPTPPDYGRVDGVMNKRRNGSAWEAAFGVNAPLPLTGDELARRDIAEQYWRLADLAVALFNRVLARDGGQMPASYGSYFGLYNGADSRTSGTGYAIVDLGPRPIDTGYPNTNFTWDVLAQP